MNNKKYDITLIELLNKDLVIPEYQRPYEWNRSNVFTLLNDIIESYNDNSKINLGAIILCQTKNIEKYEIVELSL